MSTSHDEESECLKDGLRSAFFLLFASYGIVVLNIIIKLHMDPILSYPILAIQWHVIDSI